MCTPKSVLNCYMYVVCTYVITITITSLINRIENVNNTDDLILIHLWRAYTNTKHSHAIEGRSKVPLVMLVIS